MITNRRSNYEFLASGDGARASNSGSGYGSLRPDEIAKTDIRVLIILNNNKNLQTGMSFLTRRGYQISTFNRITDAVHDMKQLRPQVVLLSWNLKYTDVKKIYKLLTNNFKVICIVFAEDNSTRTTASLMSSGIPHSLLAPVSGPSIHMRIQALLRAQNEPPKKERHLHAAPETQDRVKKVEIEWDQLPQDTKWESVKDKDGDKWRGISSTMSEKDVFYFTGPEPPSYDLKEERWRRKNPRTPLILQRSTDSSKSFEFTQEGLKSKLLDAVQEGLDKGKDLSAVQEGLKDGSYEAEIEAPDENEFSVRQEGPESKDFGEVEADFKEHQTGKVRHDQLAEVESNTNQGQGGKKKKKRRRGGSFSSGEEFDWDAALSSVEAELKEIEKNYEEKASESDDPASATDRESGAQSSGDGEVESLASQDKKDHGTVETEEAGSWKAGHGPKSRKDSEKDYGSVDADDRDAKNGEDSLEDDASESDDFRKKTSFQIEEEADQGTVKKTHDMTSDSEIETASEEDAETGSATEAEAAVDGDVNESEVQREDEKSDSPGVLGHLEDSTLRGAAVRRRGSEMKGEEIHGFKLQTSDEEHVVDASMDFEEATVINIQKPEIGRESLLAQALKIALQSCAKPPIPVVQSVGLVSNVHIMSVATMKFRGYVVAVTGSDIPSTTLPERVAGELCKQLRIFGEHIDVTPPVWSIKIDSFEFNAWATQKAEFIVKSPDGQDSISFAFVPVLEFPQTLEGQDDTVFGVEIAKYLVGGAALLFDLFIHLPKNDKYILYLAKGAVLNQSTIDKFVRFGITQVFIRKADKELFLAYCARNQLFWNP